MESSKLESHELSLASNAWRFSHHCLLNDSLSLLMLPLLLLALLFCDCVVELMAIESLSCMIALRSEWNLWRTPIDAIDGAAEPVEAGIDEKLEGMADVLLLLLVISLLSSSLSAPSATDVGGEDNVRVLSKSSKEAPMSSTDARGALIPRVLRVLEVVGAVTEAGVATYAEAEAEEAEEDRFARDFGADCGAELSTKPCRCCCIC